MKKKINIEFNPKKRLKNSYYNIFNNKRKSDANLQLLNERRNLLIENINLHS